MYIAVNIKAVFTYRMSTINYFCIDEFRCAIAILAF